MDLGLRGRRVVVAGASKGIGLAVAEQLAQEGCALTLVARSDANLRQPAARLEVHGVPVAVETADLSDSTAVDQAAERPGDAGVLASNAGAIPAGRLLEVDQARWRAAWDTKVFGCVNMIRRFYAAMRECGRGGERVAASYIAGSPGDAALIAFTRAIGGARGDRLVGGVPRV